MQINSHHTNIHNTPYQERHPRGQSHYERGTGLWPENGPTRATGLWPENGPTRATGLWPECGRRHRNHGCRPRRHCHNPFHRAHQHHCFPKLKACIMASLAPHCLAHGGQQLHNFFAGCPSFR